MDLQLRLALQKYQTEQTAENAIRFADLSARYLEDLDIEGILFASTSHITLAESESCGEFAYNEDNYSWWFYCESALSALEHSPNHPNLIVLLNLALSRGCSWLRLDQDGSEYEFLPMFEW